MCCFFTSLVVFGPRLAILIWWLINPVYVRLGVDGNWILAILGWVFLPWTAIMYLIVFPNGIVGFDWVLIGLGLLFDVMSYGGGGYGNRGRFRR